jgi:hypothetical protein
MGAAMRSGAAYVAVVFLAGFALGTLRTLVVAPRVGGTWAVLIETPLILAAIWWAARWCVSRFKVPATPPARLAMGAAAFVLLQALELGVALVVLHRSAAVQLASYRTAAGAVGLGAQAAFAAMPLALTWRTWRPLTLVRAVHTVIYLVMATSTLAVLYAGITGAAGAWLWIAGALVGVESAVFLGNGLKCPLTAVAVKYGSGDGADTFLPERFTRHTFHIFGPLIVIGAVLVALRWGHALPR